MKPQGDFPFLNSGRVLYTLYRLEDVAMRTAAVSHLKLLIPKLYF